jgi:5'-deoxynucleotidase YfbR-like HD superfamily hydrolase
MQANATLLDLLLEVQTLDRVPRMGFPLRGVVEGESVTEHSWHVAFLVWTLGSRLPDLDLARAFAIALVHDLAEVRIGDLPMTAGRYFPPGVKRAAEAAAMAEMLAPLAGTQPDLYAEYAAAETLEARLVKACDKLQLMLKVATYEHWGAGGLGEFWQNEENFRDYGIAPVREVFLALKAHHAGDHRG